MLYRFGDIYNNNNNNTGRLSHFWYKQVYFFLPSALGDTRRETQFIRAYANHTMMTPSLRAAHLVVSKISTDLCQLRPKLIWSDQIQKTQLPALMVLPQIVVFFKILKSSNHFFRVWRHPPTQFIPNACSASFPVWEFLMTNDDCHILSVRVCECTLRLWHLNQETLSCSKPYQTK